MKNTLKLIIVIHLCASRMVFAECQWPLKSTLGTVSAPSPELHEFLGEMIGEKYLDGEALSDFEKPEGCFELKHGYKLPLTETCVSKNAESLSIATTLDEKYHIDVVKKAIETKFPAIQFAYASKEKNLLYAQKNEYKVDGYFLKILFIQVYNAHGQETDKYTSKLSDDDKPTMIRYEFNNMTKAVKDYELCLSRKKAMMSKELVL